MRRYHVTTFGCQMNAHDSERIKGMLESLGLGEAVSPDDADVVVFNTCTVREKPDTRLAAYLGNATARKRERPDLVIAVGGCYAEAQRERIFEPLPGGRRRVRPRVDPASRGVDRRRRLRGAARQVRYARALRGRPPSTSGAALPSLGAGLDGVQLEVRVLHRPSRARTGAEPATG